MDDLFLMLFERVNGLLPLLQLAYEFLNLQVLLAHGQLIPHIFHVLEVLVNLKPLREHVPLDNQRLINPLMLNVEVSYL